jgi:hypothetical protein
MAKAHPTNQVLVLINPPRGFVLFYPDMNNIVALGVKDHVNLSNRPGSDLFGGLVFEVNYIGKCLPDLSSQKPRGIFPFLEIINLKLLMGALCVPLSISSPPMGKRPRVRGNLISFPLPLIIHPDWPRPDH